MYTNFDKALSALVVGIILTIISFLNNGLGYHFGIDQNTLNILVTAIVSAVITPLLVHTVPNLPKDPPNG